MHDPFDSSWKQDFPPLLPEGLHDFSLNDLFSLCVTRFPLSDTRKEIGNGIARLVEILEDAQIPGDLWVDGSFLTEKYDPDDSDVVLLANHVAYDDASPEQRNLLDYINESGFHDDLRCHSFLSLEFPEDPDLNATSSDAHTYWTSYFGLSRSCNVKGFAVLKVLGGMQ